MYKVRNIVLMICSLIVVFQPACKGSSQQQTASEQGQEGAVNASLPVSGAIYFVENSSGDLKRADLNTKEVTTIATFLDSQNHLTELDAIAVDVAAGAVYLNSGVDIIRVDLSTKTSTTVATGFDPHPSTIFVEGNGTALIGQSDNTISRLDLATGQNTLVVSSIPEYTAPAMLSDLVSDGNVVYAAFYSVGEVRAVLLSDGSDSLVLSVGSMNPRRGVTSIRLSSDKKYLYALAPRSGGDSSQSDTLVTKFDLTAKTSQDIVTFPSFCWGLDLNAQETKAYAACTSAIYEVDLATGQQQI